jgi:coenzyme F420-reducing hydrogenase alpha subunit
MDFTVKQIARVEGHGNIVFKTDSGKLEQVLWEVTESPRLFEVMLKSRHFDDVAHIASRICGICAVAHTLTSLQATEAAFGIKVSSQVIKLRKLLYHSETLQSHILHAYFLAAPDFLGVGSVIPLVASHPDIVKRALVLKKLTNDMADMLSGRKVHPISTIVGGFAKLPASSDLLKLKKMLEDAIPDIEATVSLFASLKFPEFARETEYISLKDPEEYAFLSGEIFSSDAGLIPVANYLQVVNEFCVPHSTAKYTRHKRESYMVGALARFNNNYEQLTLSAKKAAQRMGLKAPCFNPYMITAAQVVEIVHCFDDALRLIEIILREGLQPEEVKVKPRTGRGIGVVEAPRGILFHHYTYDDTGVLQDANCVIPTNQNHNNIQKDMDKLAPVLIDKSEPEVRLALEMLVRAYDPCISCSTH